MDSYPALASKNPAGFPLTGEIHLRPDCMWHGGSNFHELQYPVLHSDVTAQLTVGISRKNLPMKPVD